MSKATAIKKHQMAGRLESAPITSIYRVTERIEIGRLNEQPTAGTKKLEHCSQRLSWVMNMLDDMVHADEVECSRLICPGLRSTVPYFQPKLISLRSSDWIWVRTRY